MREWEKNIRRVEPYVPGEQPQIKGMIKLNTNENPYPPSKKVSKALEIIDTNEFRLYPDPASSKLIDALADNYSLKQEQIFVGVGSDDVLSMSFLTFFNSGQPILFADITYSFYSVWAELYRIPYHTCSLNSQMRMEKKDYFKKNGGIVIANPNAPTSLYEELSFIEEILQKNPGVIVIVDEAYIDFGGRSAIELIPRYDNLLVVQTFSKSRSMAGMRIGFAMGNELLIQALNHVKNSVNSYTMNYLSICLGKAVLEDNKYFLETIDKIKGTREVVKKGLIELGFEVLDSKTNFLFVSHEKIKAADLYQALREQYIFVRYFNLPRINNYLRITIGRDEDMLIFMDFVAKYVKTY